MIETWTSRDVMKITGASYRQIDYVITKFDCINLVDRAPSSGHARQFTKLGVTQIWLITQLTKVGLITAKAVEVMESMIERENNMLDETDYGFRNVWLDPEGNTGLDFVLEYYQGKPGDEWQIPWEKASTPEDQGTDLKSTTDESLLSAKTGPHREYKMLMRGYGAPSIEVGIRIMDEEKSFQVTSVEVAGGSSSGHVQIEETSSENSSSDNSSQTEEV
jgi:hypothetical protein